MLFKAPTPHARALAAACLALASIHAQAARPYLEDAENAAPATNAGASLDSHLYPRVMTHEMDTTISDNAYGKYHIIYAHGNHMQRISEIQDSYPDVMYIRHISGRAYQSYGAKYCQMGVGMAFEESGPKTQGGPQSYGCSIYAGHWLYKAGTTLTDPINATTKTLKVANASRVAVGQYVVVYDAPAGSFKNAEHAKVTGRNLSTNTLTLASRGFKSNPKSHAAGAIVAQHVLGQGSNPQLWAFNLSTKAPKDANGNTLADAYADWLKRNLTKSRRNFDAGANVAGVLFDADLYFDFKGTDANNDLVVDNGMSNSGVNWHGLGTDQFYAKVRAALPNKIILAGTSDSRGFSSLQGLQMENFPDHGNGDFNPNVKYKHLNDQIATYRYQMHSRAVGVPHSANLTKVPTNTYPGAASPRPASNAPARFSLGLTLLDGGHHGTHSTQQPDAWWDEYAVIVTPGSAKYGSAVAKSDVSGVRKHRGWLGRPLGTYRRLYDDGQYAPSQSLIANGTFDSNLNGWSGTNVNLSRVTNQTMDGTGAMRVSGHANYTKNISGATVRGPKNSLAKGQEYTLAFSARADAPREIRVNGGGGGEKFVIDSTWRRYVMSFKADTTGDKPILFDVGRENSLVWIDSVYFFAGSVNVFRRDFDNGIVVVNGTHSTRTIDLNGTFQLIKGTQDSVNSGLQVTSVTLDPFDARLLVRLDGQQSGGGSGGTDPGDTGDTGDTGGLKVCGKPANYDPATVPGIFIWKTCSTGEWKVRVAAGSASNTKFTGLLTSDRAMTGVKGVRLETRDSVTTNNAGTRVTYDLAVSGKGIDGFNFTLASSATQACFSSNEGAPVYVGKSGTPVGTPVDLANDGAACP